MEDGVPAHVAEYRLLLVLLGDADRGERLERSRHRWLRDVRRHARDARDDRRRAAHHLLARTVRPQLRQRVQRAGVALMSTLGFPATRIEIVTIGDELLLGFTID